VSAQVQYDDKNQAISETRRCILHLRNGLSDYSLVCAFYFNQMSSHVSLNTLEFIVAKCQTLKIWDLFSSRFQSRHCLRAYTCIVANLEEPRMCNEGTVSSKSLNGYTLSKRTTRYTAISFTAIWQTGDRITDQIYISRKFMSPVGWRFSLSNHSQKDSSNWQFEIQSFGCLIQFRVERLVICHNFVSEKSPM